MTYCVFNKGDWGPPLIVHSKPAETRKTEAKQKEKMTNK